MVVGDIVLNRDLPEELRSDMNLYASCIAGALKRDDYLDAIRAAGFSDVEILVDTGWQVDQAGGDPITSDACCALGGLASSITLIGRKE